jgi:hypothetical protein
MVGNMDETWRKGPRDSWLTIRPRPRLTIGIVEEISML